MKQGLSVFALLAWLAGTVGVIAEPRVVGAATALRAGPDRLYEVERRLGSGTRVDLLEISGGWGLVRLRDGMSGWVVAGQLVRPVAYRAVATVADKPLETLKERDYSSVVWPNTGRLNLRAGPGTAHSVVRAMDKGDWVKVVAQSGNWLRLQHISGDEGWAHKAYLTR